MASALIQPLLDDRVDVIGDVHGELDALRDLLARLHCDVERARVERPLIFVGDLVDRGPDSVAVVELVAHLVREGVAQVVLGNHEYNLLRGYEREGNAWFDAQPARVDGFYDRAGRHVPFDSRRASAEERAKIRAFLEHLPLALESPALRVVHAAWDHAAIAVARQAKDLPALLQLEAAEEERDDPAGAPTREALEDPTRPVAVHAELAELLMREQNAAPVRVLTSGPERALPSGVQPRFLAGRWRMLERDPWWERDGESRPVIFGHYWRRRPGTRQHEGDSLRGIDPLAWFGDRGQAFCVDYSVGRRYRARYEHSDLQRDCGLAALRFPERTLQFEDAAAAVATYARR